MTYEDKAHYATLYVSNICSEENTHWAGNTCIHMYIQSLLCEYTYGVAYVSRIDKTIGLLSNRAV